MNPATPLPDETPERAPVREACPTPSQLFDFTHGRFEVDPEPEFIAHVETCLDCSRKLDEFGRQFRDPIVSLLISSSAQDLIDYGQELPCRDVTREIAQGNITPREPTLPALTRIGKYDIQGALGQGGMGIVFRAVDSETGVPVAIKLLKTYLPQDVPLVKRFRRECRELRRVSHPNLVAALESGAVDGTPYLVMEYIAGTDLGMLVKSQGPFTVADVCEIARQVIQGLEHAWGCGIVHRDIKPSNMMLTRDAHGNGLVKILDLGLVRLLSHSRGVDESYLSYTGQVLGTTAYMAPEQAIDSHHVDHRADLYALGVSLRELLTGRVAQAAIEPMPDPLPESLCALITGLLQFDREQRLADVRSILDVVTPLAEGHRLGQRLD